MRRHGVVFALSELTLIDFHVRYRLPLVHGHEPAVIPLLSTAQVDNQFGLVTTQGF